MTLVGTFFVNSITNWISVHQVGYVSQSERRSHAQVVIRSGWVNFDFGYLNFTQSIPGSHLLVTSMHNSGAKLGFIPHVIRNGETIVKL